VRSAVWHKPIEVAPEDQALVGRAQPEPFHRLPLRRVHASLPPAWEKRRVGAEE
jgi:hypothetical protein